MQNRRQFLGGLALAGAALAAPKLPAATKASAKYGKVRLRIGVLSDIHMMTEKDVPWFENTLRKFDEWKVDGVLGASDIAEVGLVHELRMASEAWFRVFPNGKGSDGRPVVNLMHYGDHDMSEGYFNHRLAKELCPDETERRASMLYPRENRKRFWEECFREPFSQITVKEVKGYTFVLSHFTKGEPGNQVGDNVPGLDEVFAKLKVDPKKPFFYSQHRIPRNTAGGPEIWGQDDGKTTALFSNYPNLIAFGGHCHMNGAFEKNIWQGAFTCVHTPSHLYCVTAAGRENGYAIDDRPPASPAWPVKCMVETSESGCSQGMLMLVCDNAVILRRWEFRKDAAIGPDWIIPISSFALPPEEKPFNHARRAAESVAPEFAEDAKVTVSEFAPDKRRDGSPANMITVEFPNAPTAGNRLRADDYAVALELKQFDCERVFLEKRVYGRDCMQAASKMTRSVQCKFAEDEIPAGWKLRFTVRPVNCWGKRGAPISSEWTVLKPLPKA